MTDASDTRSMTYAELGKARGISAASAKRLALRHGWRKTAGNDGLARVSVPVAWLETSPTTPPATAGAVVTGDMSPAAVPVAWLIEARADAARAQGEVIGLREALQRADAAIAKAREDYQRAEAEVAALRDALAREAAQTTAERAARQAAEAEREVARGELVGWTAGGPLTRAVRAFLSRRGWP